MHDRDKLCLELGLHIMGDVFDCGGDGVMGGKQGIYDDTKVFYLEVSLVQGFKGASIIKVVVEQYGEMGVCDGSDKGGMFDGGGEQVESVAIGRDIDREDRGDFYHRWR